VICPSRNALVMPTDASLVLGREGNEQRRPTARLDHRAGRSKDWLMVKNPAAPEREAEEDWGGKRSARGMSFQMTRLCWEQFAQNRTRSRQQL
jgi:hypothetical protein